ncbi:MAG: hypothetical protein II942_03690 [Alphaproteobacteria bacterium]|nr:hypothetical protein [Alphaproteobacteria bacterium]
MDLGRISQALQDYTGQQDSMQSVTAVLQEELGENWTSTVFQDLQSLPPALKENLTHVFNYYAATTAWNELQGYLADPKLENTPEIQDRLPVLKHWLDFFGAPGQEAYQQLETKMAALAADEKDVEPNVPNENPEEPMIESAPEEPSQTDIPADDVADISDEGPAQDATEPVAEEVVADEAATEEMVDAAPAEPVPEEEPPEVFEIRKLQKQLDLLDQNEAWLSARCVQLKGIEIYAYPFYGFVVDLLRQVLKSIETIEEDEAIAPYVDKVFDGGMDALQKRKEAVQHEIELAEQNCESNVTALISEDTDMDEIKRTLGAIDSSDTVEYIGPAPDGFELLDDDAPLDEGAIKQEYEKLENKDVLTGKEAEEKVPESEPVKENTSQTPEKGVQRKMSFSLKKKKPEGTT